jgi:hypothetical protein
MQYVWCMCQRPQSAHVRVTLLSTQVSPVNLILRSSGRLVASRLTLPLGSLDDRSVGIFQTGATCRPAVPRLLPVTSKKSRWHRVNGIAVAFSVYILSKESMCTWSWTGWRTDRWFYQTQFLGAFPFSPTQRCSLPGFWNEIFGYKIQILTKF